MKSFFFNFIKILPPELSHSFTHHKISGKSTSSIKIKCSNAVRMHLSCGIYLNPLFKLISQGDSHIARCGLFGKSRKHQVRLINRIKNPLSNRWESE